MRSSRGTRSQALAGASSPSPIDAAANQEIATLLAKAYQRHACCTARLIEGQDAAGGAVALSATQSVHGGARP